MKPIPRESKRVKGTFKAVLMLLALSLFSPMSQAQTATDPDNSVLILYDKAVFKTYALTNANMLRNLLGHFSRTVTNITLKPVVYYNQGEIENHRAVFYVGSIFDEISYYGRIKQAKYRNFVADAAITKKDVIWINYNLWQMSSNWDPAWGADSFADKFGFDFLYVENGNYNRVTYKDTELYKGVVIYANPGSNLTGCIPEQALENGYACSLEINRTAIPLGSPATAPAKVYSTLNPIEKLPYVINSDNFWFVADMPFSYFSEEDRYLAFADLLHDMLRIDAAPSTAAALVRIEDVHANLDTNELDTILQYLAGKNIPFSIASIAAYIDPFGFYNNGIAQTITYPNSEIAQLLFDYKSRGFADIVLHGYTHQFGQLENPYNGVSGDDFEFYRVIENPDLSLTPLGPVSGDSRQWARSRIRNARTLLRRSGLEPFAWEAPHYLASAIDYRAIKTLYPIHYGRMTYALNNKSNPNELFGQFYPYMIGKDMYGYTVIPENLGNIEPDPNTGFRVVLPEDLIRNAEKLQVVRDGIASFYYHPYLDDPLYIKDVVEGIENLSSGYKFTSAAKLDPNVWHH